MRNRVIFSWFSVMREKPKIGNPLRLKDFSMMPSLESNMPYTSAQQRNRGERELRGERRGTGGRSSIYRRPLCLFIHFRFALAALVVTLSASAEQALAQQSSRLPTIHVRIGAMMFTPLIEQNIREVRDTSFGVLRTFTAKQQIAPVLSAALSAPLRPRVVAELSAAYARSALQGHDDFGDWDADDLSVINVNIGIRYQRWTRVSLDGSVGITKLTGSNAGIFERGNPLRPLLEAGVTVAIRAPFPLEVIARAQTHTFNTGVLQDMGAEAGQVWRGMVLVGTTFGRKR
jgi:hypothetical protein